MDKLNKTKLLLIGYDILGDKLFQSWSCYNGKNIKNNYTLW